MIYTILAIIILAAINYIQFKSNKEIRHDLQDEKSRADQYKNAMQDTKVLTDAAAEIDKQIEVKRNERKKLSKADKIALANSRNNSD